MTAGTDKPCHFVSVPGSFGALPMREIGDSITPQNAAEQ
jgi:hypothetical protein